MTTASTTSAFQFDDPLDQLIWDNAENWGYDTSALSNGSLANDFVNALKKYVYNPDTGDVNWAGVLTGAAGIYGLMGGNDIKTSGWTTPPPKLDATRMQVPVDNTNRRPGEFGQRYFTDTQYTPRGDAAALGAAQTQANTQAVQLAQQQTRPAPPPAAPVPQMRTAWEAASGGQVPQFKGGLESGGFVVPGDVVRHADPTGQANKEQGLAALHQSLGAQAIRGPGDAMSDSIPTTIDGRQPAAVANGEAYVPRQMVAQVGGGDQKRGADKLYDMMEKLRLQRTGSKKQINPDDPQQLAQAYQQGGGVRRFNGATGSAVTSNPSGTPTGTAPAGMGASTMNTLAPYIGEYVTDALGKGAAMANTPYQAYTGPLTAGASGLQQQAFAGASQLAQTGFTPGSFSSTYTAPQAYQQQSFTNQFSAPAAYNPNTFTSQNLTQQAAAQYMNPYMGLSLNPQLDEARRQADISRMADAGRLTKAGAYGGSRQAIMESEGRRNLMDIQGQITGRGYDTAYQQALAQFNADQGRNFQAQEATEQSRQFGAGQRLTAAQQAAQYGLAAQQGSAAERQFAASQAQRAAEQRAADMQAQQAAREASRQFSANYGLKSLENLAGLGQTQRDIEAQGIAADKAQFEEERNYAYAQPGYQLGLLSGIPIGGSSTTPNSTGLSSLQQQIADVAGIYGALGGTK